LLVWFFSGIFTFGGVLNIDYEWLSGVFFAVAFLPYIFEILFRDTSPKKLTWFLFFGLDLIMLLALIQEEEVNGLIVASVAGSFLTFLLSLFKGEPGFDWLDITTLAAAVCSIVVWALSGNPLYGLVIPLVLQVIAVVPTIASVLQDPGRESTLAWGLWFVGSVLAIPAVTSWTIAGAAVAVVFTVLDTLMFGTQLFSLWRRHAISS